MPETKANPDFGKVWSTTDVTEQEDRLHYRSRSKGTIIVCSVVLLALTAVLAAWIILTRPTFTPKVRIVSRSVETSLFKNVEKLEDFPYQDLRLPNTIIPTDYHIKLIVDLTKDDYNGLIQMNLRTEKNTKYIVFHLKDLEMSDVTLTSELEDEELKIKQILSYKPHEMVAIELSTELKEWKRYTLQIKYVGKFNPQLSGLYKSQYRTRLGKFTTVVTSHFEPTDARSVFPCFDEPSYKAKFHVKIVHDQAYAALTNMPVEETRALGGDVVEDTFKTSVVMSTYLVAFAVVDFKYKEGKTKSGIRVRVYAPESDYDRIDYPLDVGIKVIDYYEEFFGAPYPLPKLDLLAVPDFLAGAMEDWGIVSFRSSYLIYDQNLTTTEQKKQITLVIAHELAHQWFGNLVTMKWWNDIWLNEGFANFVEMLGTNQVNDKFHMLDLQVPSGWQSAISLDSLKNSHPIDQPVKFPSEIDELFDAISYNKGAAVLRMLHSFLGQSFISGVKAYIKNHQFGNAETDDLWENLEDANGNLTIKPIMDTWTKQKGFPIITLEREDGFLKISQKSFYLEKDSQLQKDKASKRVQVIPESFLWHVPFTYVYDSSPENANMVWLHKMPQIKVPAPKNFKWVKANLQVRGYYVVNYDKKTWKNLIAQLMKNHTVIAPVDRAGLIHDAFKLACDGILDPVIPLELSRYLKNEKDYLPWAMVRAKVDCMSMLMQTKTIKKMYKRYFWKLQSHLVEESMLEPSNYETEYPLERFQRYESFAYCMKYNLNKSFKKKLRKLFRKLKNEESIKDMPAELRALTLMFGFNTKDEADFEFLWKLYINTELDSDRRILMRAFPRFKTKKKLSSILNNTLDTRKVRMQDSIPILLTIVKVGGRKQVWNFIIEHFKDFQDRYGHGYQLGSLLSEVAGGFYKNSEYKEVKKFLDKHSIGVKGSMTEKQILEKIENNMQKHGSGKRNGAGKAITKWVQQEMKVIETPIPQIESIGIPKKSVKEKKSNKTSNKTS